MTKGKDEQTGFGLKVMKDGSVSFKGSIMVVIATLGLGAGGGGAVNWLQAPEGKVPKEVTRRIASLEQTHKEDSKETRERLRGIEREMESVKTQVKLMTEAVNRMVERSMNSPSARALRREHVPEYGRAEQPLPNIGG